MMSNSQTWLSFSSTHVLFSFTQVKYTIISKLAPQLFFTPQATIPSSCNAPTTIWTFTLFWGTARIQVGKTQANRRLHTFQPDFVQSREGAALLRGPFKAASASRHFGKETLPIHWVLLMIDVQFKKWALTGLNGYQSTSIYGVLIWHHNFCCSDRKK